MASTFTRYGGLDLALGVSVDRVCGCNVVGTPTVFLLSARGQDRHCHVLVGSVHADCRLQTEKIGYVLVG